MFLFNLPGFIAQGIGMLAVLAAVVVGAILFGQIHFGLSIAWIAVMSAWVFPSYHMFDNKFNFNDNMSGCIALLYIADVIAAEYPALKDRVCLVFSDREEAGTIGAKKLKKQLMERLGLEGFQKKILLNFDCVGGRDKEKFIMTNSDAGEALAREIKDIYLNNNGNGETPSNNNGNSENLSDNNGVSNGKGETPSNNNGVSNVKGGETSEREINGGADITIYKSPILNMDSFQFGKMPSVSFCSASPKFGVKFLLEPKDIHTNRDDFLDVVQIKEYGDLTLKFLKEKYLKN
jgi:hypothetical protein